MRDAAPGEVPFLPKLLGNFAEFLNEGSLERLRILSSSTCVGLRYGHPISSLEAFLGKCADQFASFRTPYHLSRLMTSGFAWNVPLQAWTSTSIRWMASTLTSPHRSNANRVVQEF
jgi:hypothetical protein